MSKVRKVRGVGWGISALGNGKRLTCFILQMSRVCIACYFKVVEMHPS
jgi:hypothetical protein